MVEINNLHKIFCRSAFLKNYFSRNIYSTFCTIPLQVVQKDYTAVVCNVFGRSGLAVHLIGYSYSGRRRQTFVYLGSGYYIQSGLHLAVEDVLLLFELWQRWVYTCTVVERASGAGRAQLISRCVCTALHAITFQIQRILSQRNNMCVFRTLCFMIFSCIMASVVTWDNNNKLFRIQTE